MKKFNEGIIIVFVFITIICFESNSQVICNVEILPENPTNQDTIKVYSGVFFMFGAPGSCPTLSGYTLIKGDSCVLLNLFFDISGPWPQYGCASSDTTEIGKLEAGNYLMSINVNTIFDSDTSFMEDSDSLEFTVINSSDVYESEMVNKLIIYPNPAGEYVVFEFEVQGSNFEVGNILITDIFGRKVVELPLKSEKIVWDCREMENGVYFYILKIEGEKFSGKLVINKQSK